MLIQFLHLAFSQVHFKSYPTYECWRLQCNIFSLFHFIRLARQVPDPELFKDVIDIEDGISKNTRSLYPKVGAKTKYLHDFLHRRTQLKSIEERRLELSKPAATEKTTPVATPAASAANEIAAKNAAKLEELNKFVDESKKSLWAALSKLKDAAPVPPTNNVVDDKLKRPEEMNCYSPMCAKGVSGYSCYSLMCPNYPTVAPPTPSAPAAIPALEEALALYTSLCQQASRHGITIESKELSTVDQATSELQNFVKVLMQKREEEANKLSAAVNGNNVTASGDGSHVTKSAVAAPPGHVSEETKKREALEGRIYSCSDPSGKLYLKRIQSVADPKGKSKEIRYPLAPSFHSQSRNKKNILILAKYDVKRMARKAGMVTAEGFNYNAKANNQASSQLNHYIKCLKSRLVQISDTLNMSGFETS